MFFLYQDEQQLWFDKVSQPIGNFSTLSLNRQVDIFMNGINTELDPRNLPIVFAVQTYILQTKRFNSPRPPTPPSPRINIM